MEDAWSTDSCFGTHLVVYSSDPLHACVVFTDLTDMSRRGNTNDSVQGRIELIGKAVVTVGFYIV